MSFALLLLGSGCYFVYPHEVRRHPTSGPPGSTITIKKTNRVSWSDCRHPRYEGCEFRKGKWQQAYRYLEGDVRLDGKRLVVGEVRALGAPDDHEQKVREVEKDKGVCKVSLVPSVLAALAGVATTVVVVANERFEKDTLKTLLIAGYSSTVGLGVLSYPLGGYACTRARRTATRLGMSNDDVYGFVVPERKGEQQRERAREIEQLARQFNERARQKPSAPTPKPEDPQPEDPPPAKSPPREEMRDPTPITPQPGTSPTEPAKPTWNVGDKVSVKWKSTWYNATILEVLGDDRYKIHYDGYASSWDEVVPSTRIRRR
jgi:hypothetical protein